MNAYEVKQVVRPLTFFQAELCAFCPNRRTGWVDGGLCPFHHDRRPGSFKVNVDSGAFKCFSCGASGGDIIAFLMRRDGIGFRDALLTLSSEWRVPT